MGQPYTTKVPAHAVTQGMLVANFGRATWRVRTTCWVTGNTPATKHQYVGTLINGIPFLYNQPVEIVVGGACKAR